MMNSCNGQLAYQNEDTHLVIFKCVPVPLSLPHLVSYAVDKVEQNQNRDLWQKLITILNLPRHLRNLFGSILLLGIIPGNGKLEPKNLDPYLEVEVDELQELNRLKIYERYHNAMFNSKVEILLNIMDYPGIGKVFT